MAPSLYTLRPLPPLLANLTVRLLLLALSLTVAQAVTVSTIISLPMPLLLPLSLPLPLVGTEFLLDRELRWRLATTCYSNF